MGMVYRRKWKGKAGVVHEGDVWWIKYYREGKPYRESSESTKEGDAKHLLKKREGSVVNGEPVIPRMGKVTIDELLTDLQTEYRTNQRDTADDLEGRIRLHLKPFFGGRRAAAITTADIRRFIDQRQKAKASNGEVNRELSAVKRAFNLAVQGGKLLHKPHIPMLKENNTRKGFFEREQFDEVRLHLAAHLQPIVTFAYITGWRTRSEILPLKWDQVDFEASVIRLHAGTTKNDDAREFPFTDELEKLLKAQGALVDALLEKGVVTEFVFFTPNGQRVRDFRKSWDKACKAAGLAIEVPTGKRNKNGEAITKIKALRILHDFRRTAVRNLVRAGIHERLAMQMTGHKTRSVFERYNVTSGADMKEAAKKLNEFAKSAGTVSGTVAPETGIAAKKAK